MTAHIDFESQSHLETDINLDYMVRSVHTTVDWCVATTTLTVTPSSGKKGLITRISFVTYNPAADFDKTVTVETYNGTSYHSVIEAVGYAPLLATANRVDSFKIGISDIILISWSFRNGIKLKNSDEHLRVTTSGLITGTDKFYCGVNAIEY